MSYELVQEDSIEASMMHLKQGDYNGCNVTAPFKEDAMCYVTDPSAVCKTLQATNLLLFKEDHTYAFNTDYLAVRRLLQEDPKCSQCPEIRDTWNEKGQKRSQCPENRDTWNEKEGQSARGVRKLGTPQAKKGVKCSRCPEIRDTSSTVLVVGCGGAGKAAALAAKDEGLNTLITNRTAEKATAFAKSIGIKAISPKDAYTLISSFIDSQSDHSCNSNPETNSCSTKTETNSCSNRLLVIYALPQKDELLHPLLQKYKQESSTENSPHSRNTNMHSSIRVANSSIAIIEANYKDPCLNPTTGRKWLLYQAIESFRLMTGMEPDFTSMSDVIKQKKLSINS